MRRIRIVACTVALMASLAPMAARGWIYRTGSAGGVLFMDMELDSAGNVVVTGIDNYGNAGPQPSPSLSITVKLSPDGRELWRYSRPDMVLVAVASALTADDDVVLVGSTRNGSGVSEGIVLKLDGATGTEIWSTPEPETRPQVVVIDPGTGDVIAGTYHPDFVGRYAASDGTRLWTTSLTTGGVVAGLSRLVVDAGGDVIWGGVFNPIELDFPAADDLGIAKLSGADGSELWRRTVDVAGLGDEVQVVMVDAAGDVVVGGRFDDGVSALDSITLTLDDATGAEQWRHETLLDGGIRWLLADPGGDVFTGSQVSLSRLGSADGALVWSTPGLGEALSFRAPGVLVTAAHAEVDAATGIASWRVGLFDPFGPLATDVGLGVDSTGAVVTASSPGLAEYLKVVRFSDRLAGRKLVVKDSALDPSRRKLVALSKDPNVAGALTNYGSRPSSTDPAVAGATLQLSNPSTGESAVLDLPAANWTSSKDQRHVYKDKTRSGPCSKVTIEGGRRLKLKCAGAGIGFTLDEPSQGGLDVVLTVTGGMRYCMSFAGPGVVLKDQPAVGTATGTFVARDAPAPAACPS